MTDREQVFVYSKARRSLCLGIAVTLVIVVAFIFIEGRVGHRSIGVISAGLVFCAADLVASTFSKDNLNFVKNIKVKDGHVTGLSQDLSLYTFAVSEIDHDRSLKAYKLENWPWYESTNIRSLDGRMIYVSRLGFDGKQIQRMRESLGLNGR